MGFSLTEMGKFAAGGDQESSTERGKLEMLRKH